jgi:hypothetical protein
VVCVWANCRSLVELESVSHDLKNTENLCNHPKEAETGNYSRERAFKLYKQQNATYVSCWLQLGAQCSPGQVCNFCLMLLLSTYISSWFRNSLPCETNGMAMGYTCWFYGLPRHANYRNYGVATPAWIRFMKTLGSDKHNSVHFNCRLLACLVEEGKIDRWWEGKRGRNLIPFAAKFLAT